MEITAQFVKQNAVIEEPTRVIFSVQPFNCGNCNVLHWGLYAGFLMENKSPKRLTSVALGNYNSKDAALSAIGTTYLMLWYMVSDVLPMVQVLDDNDKCVEIKQLDEKYVEDGEVVSTH